MHTQCAGATFCAGLQHCRAQHCSGFVLGELHASAVAHSVGALLFWLLVLSCFGKLVFVWFSVIFLLQRVT
jgi:hypothetical protein